MKYAQCNEKCEPEKGLHWLGDRFFLEGVKCSACGGTGRPHVGFGYPCSASTSGSHHFEDSSERDHKSPEGQGGTR